MCGGAAAYCMAGAESVLACVPGHEATSPYLPKYARVVTISQAFGSEFFHFFAENLTRIMLLLDEILADHSIMVHIFSKEAAFVRDALQLLGVTWDRIVQGDGCAGVLYIPEPVGCGAPSFEMLHWTRRRLRHALGCPMPKNDMFKYVVLIKRFGKREVQNHEEIRGALATFLQGDFVSMTKLTWFLCISMPILVVIIHLVHENAYLSTKNAHL
jgi:hypothetical protein